MKKLITAFLLMLFTTFLVHGQSVSWSYLSPNFNAGGAVLGTASNHDTTVMVGYNLTNAGPYATHNIGLIGPNGEWLDPGPGFSQQGLDVIVFKNRWFIAAENAIYEYHTNSRVCTKLCNLSLDNSYETEVMLDTLNNTLVVAGAVTSVNVDGETTQVNHVFGFDPGTRSLWSLGTGCDYDIMAIAATDTQLYAFYDPGTVGDLNRILVFSTNTMSMSQYPVTNLNGIENVAIKSATYIPGYGIMYGALIDDPNYSEDGDCLVHLDATGGAYTVSTAHAGGQFSKIRWNKGDGWLYVCGYYEGLGSNMSAHHFARLDPQTMYIDDMDGGPQMGTTYDCTTTTNSLYVVGGPSNAVSRFGMPTGIQNLQTFTHCSIGPNPCTSEISISWQKNFEGKIEIYNSLGQLVFNKQVSGLETEISTETFSSGIYFLKAKTNTSDFAQTVVKQ